MSQRSRANRQSLLRVHREDLRRFSKQILNRAKVIIWNWSGKEVCNTLGGDVRRDSRINILGESRTLEEIPFGMSLR